MSYLIEYINKCKNGEIIIGQDLMALFDMLISDLDNPLYRFDTTEPHKRIKFIETQCKHSISPFAGDPFLLELHQKARIEALYGFYMEIDGKWIRRFTRILLLIGRKNGKTTECAGISNAEFFCGNTGTNILCASNDYEQAGLVFDEINAMREESRSLEKVTRKNIKGIFFGNPKQKNKKGKFSAQNKAKIKKLSVKTGAKEGKNIDCAIVDEVHEMKDDSLVMPIWQSMSTKDEPLLIEITTEGFTQDGYLDKQLIQARKVLNGEIERPRWLVWLYTQDNEQEIWQDRSSWVKSNPNLGISKKWAYLDEMVESSKTDMQVRAFMLAKDFNIKQNNANAWLSYNDYQNENTFNLEQLRGWYYISGNDFAETTDLCSNDMMFMDPATLDVYFHSHYWICESKADEKDNSTNPEKKDYRLWAKQGYCTILKGNNVDVSVIADYHYELYKNYGIKPFKIGYDNRFIKDFQKKIIEYFGDDLLENIPQKGFALSNPMRTLEADLKDKKVNYNNNPISRWCFSNTSYKTDNLGFIIPCKMSRENRIDGTASKIICYATLEKFKSEFLEIIRR